ncbi:MAG: cardiolipin synthase ClsB [Rhodocyclaceae bacterium]|jgi:cardiolipin synthase|nr:Cardiolipin synthase B [Rhodocyclaceae bacterium]MBZ0142159.1 cardiolipin synthase ClsB [Rhodocyclaceae bacterium]MCC6878397.1 cardiolipin synthase ClsB [Rhodocyclaceae bacterium]MCL4680641.1 cardiolipin synthase ClsB [Rhodocyclaceae bacterium]
MKAEFLPGNALELLETGRDFFPALIAAIDAAQREFHLETYIFEDDASGRAVAAALCRAAQRGVAVRVLADGFGAAHFSATLRPQLEAAGVKVLIYRPEIARFRLRRHRLRRLHRKLAVADGRCAFVGGINIVDDIDAARPAPPRFDYAVRIEGPLLAPIHASVRRLWTLVAWAGLRRRLRLPAASPVTAEPRGSTRAAFVIRDNLRHRRDIEEAYLEAIDRARGEILIANAYFLPGGRFRQALLGAAARGVRVTVLLQGRVEYALQHYATQSLYDILLRAGIRIFEYHSSFLHAKVAVIDCCWATVGSSNIDPFSLLLAREANVFVDDKEFAAGLRASLEAAMREGARELRCEDWRRKPWLQRLASRLAYGLVRLMIGIAGFGGKH